MPDREKVFDALRSCITEPKCKDCPWETCEEFHQSKWIPLDLCLDILKLLKEDCHNCKLECLLQKYDELKEKYDELLKEQENLLGIHQTADGITFISTGTAQQGEERGILLGKSLMHEWIYKELLHKGLLTDDIRSVFEQAKRI